MPEIIGTTPEDVAADFNLDSTHIKSFYSGGTKLEIVVDNKVQTVWVPGKSFKEMREKGENYLKKAHPELASIPITPSQDLRKVPTAGTPEYVDFLFDRLSGVPLPESLQVRGDES